MPKLTLYEGLKNSYNPQKTIGKNYILDDELSNDNQQVYVNRKKNNKLLFSVTGTRLNKLQDLGTDLYLAAGKLKDTNRYKEAESTLEKAKKKYNKNNATIIGHSLGSTIGSYIKKPEDRFVGLDAGYTIGQPTREGEHYRVKNDVISGLGSKNSNMRTINKNTNLFNAHGVDNIKDEQIFI
jgi:hypothetical protein